MNKHTSYALIVISAFFMNACSQVQQQAANSHRSSAPPSAHSSARAPAIQSSQQNSRVSQIPQQRPQQSPVANMHPARARMVQIARSTIGTPYKWGGNSPQRGFDCSGLMSYVHKNALGLKIPRTAANQRDKSRTINYNQLQPGDMLFFKTGKKTNHVGVYIGNRKFIHAPSGGKRVKVASMDSSYWFKRFVKFGTYL
jgi:cell wall-associated NlpC family hydrolase